MIYKNFNQYNYTILTLEVNTKNKTYKLYHGQCCPMGYDKKVTKKYIYNLIDELVSLNYKEGKQ